jgi:hypothetical protein
MYLGVGAPVTHADLQGFFIKAREPNTVVSSSEIIHTTMTPMPPM